MAKQVRLTLAKAIAKANMRRAVAVAARKVDAPAAVQAAIVNVAELSSISGGG